MVVRGCCCCSGSGSGGGSGIGSGSGSSGDGVRGVATQAKTQDACSRWMDDWIRLIWLIWLLDWHCKIGAGSMSRSRP